MDVKPRILIVDDEIQILRLLKVALAGHDYAAETAETGAKGLRKAAVYKPDVILLDLGLPDMEGAEVLSRIREWSHVPVIILTARDAEREKVALLDQGADDYLTKPFGIEELLARIRVALRHTSGLQNEPVLTFEDVRIDLSHRHVFIKGEEVKLTPTEYELLKQLATQAGKVLTHKMLLTSIWGKEYVNEPQYLRVFIAQLRRKLGEDPTSPRHLITEPGVGYRWL